jgi:hypothetical protein
MRTQNSECFDKASSSKFCLCLCDSTFPVPRSDLYCLVPTCPEPVEGVPSFDYCLLPFPSKVSMVSIKCF